MCNIPTKRYLLPLIGIIGVIAVDGVISYTYLPFVVGVSSFILFWNFPKLAVMFNSRPTYYEDLFIDNRNKEEMVLDDDQKKWFENVFEWSLIVSSSMLCAALSCYWLFNAEAVGMGTFFEIVGITGGILKIYYVVNFTIGSIIIYFLKKKINNNMLEESELIVVNNEIYLTNDSSLNILTTNH
jgi:hypothetical protein